MLFERLFPSMFQRRLLLLLGLVLLSLVALGVKLADLTIAKADTLRGQAESRLTRSVWTPTVRGKILDRKGRVLSQDRASYAVGLDYPVISGVWASERARAFVRRCYKEQWRDMPEAERVAAIAEARTTYESHLSHAFDELAHVCGISREFLDAKIAEERTRVESMARTIAEATMARERQEARERDEIVTPELEKAIERRANQPIREMKQAQRVLPRVPDPVAFELQYLEGEEVDLAPLGKERGARSVDHVSRIPGLHVFDSGDREYPLDSATVELDLNTFPADLRAKGKVSIAVEGIASHIIGWMRDRVYKEDNDKRLAALKARSELMNEAMVDLGGGIIADRGEYRDGDRVGEAGIENGAENTLRGLRGRITRHIDTGELVRSPAQAGRDVTLTIDAMLQARVQAAMQPEAGLAKVQAWHRSTEPPNPTMPDGAPITGAAVVLDIDTGQILAMVSTPEVSRLVERETPAVLDDPVEMPRLNRAIGRGYPPGSIVKPLILSEAITRGAYSLDQTIACTGHLFPNNENMYRCWIFKRSQHDQRLTHSAVFGHDLSGPDAIMVSCNVFFFTLGKRLGPEGIRSAYEDFGVGTPFELGIGEEHRGSLGKPVVSRQSDAQGKVTSTTKLVIEVGDAITMGIGQGSATWTPLHAANAYATLARYGAWISPSVIIDRADHSKPSVHLDPAAVTAALEGLHRSANEEQGTGNHLTLPGPVHEPIFNAPNVEVWGKTGTAEASKIYDPEAKRDANEPGIENLPSDEHDGVNPANPFELTPPPKGLLRSGDHSWFVVLVGPKGDRPRYAISVVMDYAGSGGKVSGPIVNQIIHALIAEGYL